MRILYRYLFKYKGMSIIRILTNICKAGCSVLLSVFLGNVLDGLTSTKMDALISSVIHCAILIVFFVIVSGLDILITTLQTKKLLNYIKHDIFSKIINGNIENYRSMHSGKYISILNNDISIISEEFINNFFELIFQLLSFVVSLIIMLRISKIVTFIILGISIISIIAVSRISNILMKRQVEFSKSLENVTKLATDIFSGMLVIKNYNIVDKMEEIYYSSDEIVEENRKKYSTIVGAINIMMVCFSMITYLTIILFCANSVMNATLSAGTALIIIQISGNLTDPINEVISIVSSMHSVKGIGEKIENLDYGNEELEAKKIHKSFFEKEITLKNINFCYDNNKQIINNLNVKLEKGKKYALVGESGSGKTTFIRLLLKYYNNYSGDILIDNINMKDISSDDYCHLVSSMEQDTFIFDETLWDNICLYSIYDEKDVRNVIEQADLSKVVEQLPKGLQTVLGENGSNLSGGECQRVAFARLLLRKTPILLLDEATANLDNSTTYKVENIVLANKELTLISVTHKLIKDILQKYDEIIVLRKGTIIEKGAFDELIRKKGYFYNLYNIQSIEG